jgi:hypothetical protein
VPSAPLTDGVTIIGHIQRSLHRADDLQNRTASTFTGTVSLVKVRSALNVVVITRVSIQ